MTSNRFKCLYLGVLAGGSILLSAIHILTDGAKLIALFCVLLIAGLGVAAFRYRNKLVLSPAVSTVSETFSTSALGFLFLTVLLASLYFKSAPAGTLAYTEDVNRIVSAFVKVFAGISVLYFLLSAAWLGLQEQFGLHLALSFAPVLFFAVRILNEFINSSTNPLAESRGYLMFSLIFFMLFFLSESKAMVIRGNAFPCLLFGAAAVVSSTVYNTSNLIHYLNGETSAIGAVYSILSLALAIHVIIRLANLPSLFPESEELVLHEDELVMDRDVVYVKSAPDTDALTEQGEAAEKE